MDIDKLAAEISRALARDKNAVSAYLAGSFVMGDAGKDSDVDLVVTVTKKQSDVADRIYSLIKDIEFPKDLDLTVVDKTSSPLFLFQVISRGKRIYQASERAAAAFEAAVLHGYYDTAHLRNIYFSYLKEKFPQPNYAN
jgi:predicted nucleotidyltransferase